MVLGEIKSRLRLNIAPNHVFAARKTTAIPKKFMNAPLDILRAITI